MNVLKLFQKIYNWFNEGSIVEEVANVFTIVTIINSYMMVVGWDQPKVGVFAYVHLLSRLAIIIVVIGLWEYKEIFEKIKIWVRNEKAINCHSKEKQVIKKWINKISQSYVSLISVCFTMIIVLTSSVNISLQGMVEPIGGKELYQNLLFLYGVLFIVFFAFSMYKIHGAKDKSSYGK